MREFNKYNITGEHANMVIALALGEGNKHKAMAELEQIQHGNYDIDIIELNTCVYINECWKLNERGTWSIWEGASLSYHIHNTMKQLIKQYEIPIKNMDNGAYIHVEPKQL